MTNQDKKEEHNQHSYGDTASNIILSVSAIVIGTTYNYQWLKTTMKCTKFFYGMDPHYTTFHNEHKGEAGAIIFGGISSAIIIGINYGDSTHILPALVNYNFLTAESTLFFVGEIINSSTLEYFAGGLIGAQIIYNYYTDTIVDVSNSLIDVANSLLEMGKNLHYDTEYETL